MGGLLSCLMFPSAPADSHAVDNGGIYCVRNVLVADAEAIPALTLLVDGARLELVVVKRIKEAT